MWLLSPFHVKLWITSQVTSFFFITAYPAAFSWSGLHRVYFKTQGWLALHGGGGGCVTLLYVHRWSAILACLNPDSLWLCFGWRRDEIMCVGNVCLSIRISGVEPLNSGGSLSSWSCKWRDCLGGSVLGRDWFEVILFWLPGSLGGVVFGHTYNEGHVFYLAVILMQITLGIITIRGTKAVVIDHIFFFGTQHSWHHWQFLVNRSIFKPLHRVQNLYWFM